MLNAEQCWASVTARDAAADGAFVYAVRTSGVYCRPACPSRLPLRGNVAFFESNAAAEQAGFRACKRCRPCDASPADRHVAAIERRPEAALLTGPRLAPPPDETAIGG
jgi:AraC family transcriptional regulator of adaptative response/methylated-DNA-[protein]-cysteine methyltransferase